MPLPITLPYTFANATTAIPLANLDSDLVTLRDGINGIGNGTNALSNVSITGGTITNVTVTSSNISTLSNGTSNVAIAAANGNITMATNGAERLRIDTNGFVGIGTTTNPANSRFFSINGAVQLSGGTSAQPGIRIQQSSGTVATVTGINNDNNAYNPIAFFTSASEAMRITSSGDVGIGTSSPTALLDVNGNVAITGTARRITGDFSNATVASRIAFQTSTTNSNTSVGVIPNGTATQGGMNIFNASDPTNAGLLQLIINATETRVISGITGTGTYLPLTFFTNGSERMRITTGGEVYIAGTTDQGAYNLQCNGTGVWGAGAYVNGSDVRLKEDVKDLPDALGIVNALRPVTFRYKADYSRDTNVQPGFIAQELQEALAETEYADGVVQAGSEYLNVAYQALIPVLTKALQEANAKIDALEARVAALEGSV